ncbi:hypothetical protein CIB48_g1084 [Xylaria polymorpha]|nr:hypothetical protein CIB48_g1084 [Xylaria polymorpha]
MAPMQTVDHNVLEQQLKDTIQSLHNVMVQVTAYDGTTSTSTSAPPPPPSSSSSSSSSRTSRDVLAAELTALSRSLQTIHRTATTRTLPLVPPELVQYVDGGRNPDVYTREFVELVRRGNQLMRGKQSAFATFRDVLAGEIESAMPELRDDAARVVAVTGGRAGTENTNTIRGAGTLSCVSMAHFHRIGGVLVDIYLEDRIWKTGQRVRYTFGRDILVKGTIASVSVRDTKLARLRNNGVARLLGTRLAAEILGPHTTVQHVPDGRLDDLGLFRLVDAIAPLAVRDAAQARARAEADAAGDDAGLVADDVAEQVARDDDAVEAAGVLDHDHGGAVDELVVQLQLGELVAHDLSDDLAFRGEYSTNDGDGKKHGRRLPYVPISLRSLRMPCSGRTAPVPHSGPPMAPSSTASAALAASRAASVAGRADLYSFGYDLGARVVASEDNNIKRRQCAGREGGKSSSPYNGAKSTADRRVEFYNQPL